MRIATPTVARRTWLLVLLCLACPGLLANALAAGTPLTYAADIQPIMDKHCTGCHGWWFPRKGLRLDSRANILKGGASGPAIVPGDPSKGWLMRLVNKETAGGKLMPPAGNTPLSEDEIRRIEDWIRQGAH